jgi:hypothetical protein
MALQRRERTRYFRGGPGAIPVTRRRACTELHVGTALWDSIARSRSGGRIRYGGLRASSEKQRTIGQRNRRTT